MVNICGHKQNSQHLWTFSNTWMITFEIRFEFNLIVFVRVQSKINQHCVNVTSHYFEPMIDSWWTIRQAIARTNDDRLHCDIYASSLEVIVFKEMLSNITMTSWWAWWRLKSPACRLFAQTFVQAQIKKTSKFRVTGFYYGNPPVTGGFPAHRASNA